MGRRYDRTCALADGKDHNDPDLEKYDSERTDSSVEFERNRMPSTYSNSSRETSGSYEPMLPSSDSRRKQQSKSYKPPGRKTVRCLCLALFTTLLIFILALIRASWTSSRQLEIGLVEKQPLKPPLWEDFPFLKRYFGGIRSLVPREKNIPEYPGDQEPELAPLNVSHEAHQQKSVPKSLPFDPYPNYQSTAYKMKYGVKHDCYFNTEDPIQIPRVHYYDGVPLGQPDAVMGSHNVLGLREDICFERFGRLGPYGYGYGIRRGGTGAGLNGEREGAEDMWKEEGNTVKVDYTGVKWVAAQDACAYANKMRFGEAGNATSNDELFLEMHAGVTQTNAKSHITERDFPTPANQTKAGPGVPPPGAKTFLPRTAIVIRTWWDRQYSVEDIIYLRSLIVELSLLSGGEYTVHFLVHVRDDNVPIWAATKIYNRVLENSLPKEFHGMGSLWSERQMSLIYGGLQESFFRDLPVHGVYRGAYLALQYFSHQNPKYEYLWNWEMDVRYTGQWYHLFDRVTRWSKDQPRKGLWERNGRFYIPSVHGTWEDFKQMVRVQSEIGTSSPNNVWSGLKAGAAGIPGLPQGKTDKPVWGPEGPADMLDGQDDATPPTTVDKDKYMWGVGEEADLITFSPLFDPDGTTWFYVNDVTGYNTTQGLPRRRATIGTSSRLSRRLLQTMHRETVLERHHMFTEMWPASIALHHGYKAVFAPHPVYIDRKWPTAYLAGVMNGGRNGASGGARTSVYGGREHNFKGTTWFYDAGFASNLWRRWLGYKVDNDGGEQEEMAGEGRMCLPGMLLHPVKDVNMVVEGEAIIEEEEIRGMGAVSSESELEWEDD